ncbi:LysR family transcriptional regulator [Neotabrizicola shimadae]|uniref:LysR family transcriptional regulator n=1 Tax=Neotabrizicola shimadae TaxID=2807096 RepID=A0A8G0ZVU3_9RHOB|nr:LysR family transcriptional regulator [Neotabrizicola shimadae]QYZ69600.1 LysR family transcriptional regulator [Neotabrizicola shimadae]
MKTNLRHLRVFLSVFDTGSITRASEANLVSQPSVTQAIGKLERLAGQALFLRRPQGLFPTPAGETLANRVRRALLLLDPALTELAPRLRLTATAAQLQALIAVREAENFTLAARRMGLAQPTVHRAVTQLEQEAARPLFERTSYGMVATRPAQVLAQAARLAFAELDQAEADLAELAGREVGRIVIGAMPLSRSYLLPRALAQFRKMRPTLPVKALDGPYDDLMAGLRRGEVDLLIGALRDPPPIGDVEQTRLFDDRLALVARPGHPLGEGSATLEAAARYPFVVSTEGTPTRATFDRLIGPYHPPSLVETGSMILMRELLVVSDHVGCISELQVQAEIRLGAVVRLAVDLPGKPRPIGLTTRRGWLPTRAQADFLSALTAAAPPAL